MRRITLRIRKLLRDADIKMECRDWCRDSKKHFEDEVFHRNVSWVEMKMLFYYYLKAYGRVRIAKICRVSERRVREFIDMMREYDTGYTPTESDILDMLEEEEENGNSSFPA